ncbi:MAG: hypothetical protein KC468_10565 [Myxococcales bacterium]|nr:hypothetical protein [Myxococcales bacterium]
MSYSFDNAVIESLPEHGAPKGHLVFATVMSLKRRGLIDQRLFSALRESRPERATDITEVMRTMCIENNRRSEDSMLPEGWFVSGSERGRYRAMMITDTEHRVFSALTNTLRVESGFGTLIHTFDAREYRGKRLRYRALLRTHAVSGWAGIWMRADADTRRSVAFDNMRRRALSGTRDWTPCKIVLDIPVVAVQISLGVLLNLEGQVDMLEQSFEETDEPVTEHGITRGPRNLW